MTYSNNDEFLASESQSIEKTESKWGFVDYVTPRGAHCSVCGRISTVRIGTVDMMQVDLPGEHGPVFEIVFSEKAIFAIRYLDRSIIEAIARKRPCNPETLYHASYGG
jgi:hypothetical protein